MIWVDRQIQKHPFKLFITFNKEKWDINSQLCFSRQQSFTLGQAWEFILKTQGVLLLKGYVLG